MPQITRWKTFLAVLKRTRKNFLYILGIAVILYVFIVGCESLGIKRPDSEADQNLLQSFIEWYAVFLSLVLGFIIGQGWRRHLRVNEEIDREADALSMLVRTGDMCGTQSLSDALARAVRLYVEATLGAMTKDKRKNSPTTEKKEREESPTDKKMKIINLCVEQIISHDQNLETSVPECIKNRLLACFLDAYDARGDRFDLIAEKLPWITWVTLGVFSCTWLWGFIWLKFDSPSLNLYVSLSILLALSFLFFIALQLDDPTKGFFKMDFSPFRDNVFEDVEETNQQKGNVR